MRILVPPCALALAFLLAPGARSQTGPETKDGKLVLKLTVNPAAPPVPVLRYALLPTLRDARPGNQIQGFYKCFGEQQNLFFNKEEVEKREKWQTVPLADLKGVKELDGYGGFAVRQARRAARMESVDWQVLTDLKEDGINLLLPDIQQMRELARVLRVRARGEIARGDFAAAVETIQTQMALARTFNEHPTFIGSLVGIAVTAQAMASVEELITQPGTPNLFWALADLPNPLFDIRKSGQGERLFLNAELDPYLDRVNPMSEAQIGRAVMKVTALLDLVGDPKYPPEGVPKGSPPPKSAATILGERAADATQVAEARAKLMPAPPVRDERIKNFPPLQVILLDEMNRYEAVRDDLLKWLSVPAWQLPADLEKNPPPGLLTKLVPAIQRVAFVKTRIQQQIAMLQVVEGLRAFAAANGGRLPGTLDEVRLPLPNDPFTGKPFVYELLNGVGVVRGTPPAAGKGDPMLNRVYEVTLRK